MKRFQKMVWLLMLVMLSLLLVSCFGGLTAGGGNDNVTFTVDWGGEDGKITYRGLKHDKDYGWISSRDFYTLEGVFTQPNGQGTLVLDTAGNLVANSIEDDGTYYAYWKPITVVISLVTMNDSTFEDGTFRKDIVTNYDAMLPDAFPIGTDEDGVVYSRWRVSTINGQLATSTYLTDANGVLDTEAEKVSDLCTLPPKDNVVYTIKLTNISMGKVSVVTLDYGSGMTEQLGYHRAEDLTDYHLWYEDTGDRELVGWATHPTERGDYVTDIERVREDVTLYAVWRYYRDITLHIHNGKTQKLRVYQNEPFVLFEAAPLVGTEFENWYTDAGCTTVASRIITYENAQTDYYAKYVPKAELDEGSHRLTLIYSEGVEEVLEIKAGQSIENYLWYEDTGEKELLGWLAALGEEYVTGGELTSDTELVASWRAYRTIDFHIYNGKIKTERIYEGMPYKLWTAGALAGMEFSGWCVDVELENSVSIREELSYETAASDYYAYYVRE